MQGERFDCSSSFARVFLLFVVVTFKQAEIPKHISSEVAKPFFVPGHRLARQVWVQISFKDLNYKLLSKRKFANRSAVMVHLFVSGQLPESTLFIRSNIPSPVQLAWSRVRETPSSFCAFEFSSAKSGTEEAWRERRDNQGLRIKSRGSKWAHLEMFVRFVTVPIRVLYLFIMFIYIQVNLMWFLLFVPACFTLATLGCRQPGCRPTGTDALLGAEPF